MDIMYGSPRHIIIHLILISSFLWGIHVKRDNRRSIAYSEELIFPMAATLQSTDRHHGIVGQEYCHLQRDSCIRPTEHPEPGGSHRAFQKQRTSTPPGD